MQPPVIVVFSTLVAWHIVGVDPVEQRIGSRLIHLGEIQERRARRTGNATIPLQQRGQVQFGRFVFVAKPPGTRRGFALLRREHGKSALRFRRVTRVGIPVDEQSAKGFDRIAQFSFGRPLAARQLQHGRQVLSPGLRHGLRL